MLGLRGLKVHQAARSVLGRHDVALDQQGADQGRRRLWVAGLASAEFHENCARLGKAVLRGQGLGETEQRRELAGACQQGVVPTVLRRDRVAGILRDPGQLGCRPRIPGRRRQQLPAQPLSLGEPGLGTQGADHAESAVEMVRGKPEHALPVAQGEIRPSPLLGEACAGDPQLDRGVPGFDRLGQGRVRGLGVVRARQAAGDGDQQLRRQRAGRDGRAGAGGGIGQATLGEVEGGQRRQGRGVLRRRPAAGAPAPPRRPCSGPATRRPAAGAAG